MERRPKRPHLITWPKGVGQPSAPVELVYPSDGSHVVARASAFPPMNPHALYAPLCKPILDVCMDAPAWRRPSKIDLPMTAHAS